MNPTQPGKITRAMMSTSPIHSSGQNKKAFASKGDNRGANSKNEINENELSAGMLSSLERVPNSLKGGSRI